MQASVEYYELCRQLGEAGLAVPWQEGQRVGRGYADLGIEEFLVLPGRRLVSLISGSGSEVPEGHERFFFWIPSVDECIDEIDRRGWDLLSATFHERRTWHVQAIRNGVPLSGCAGSIEQACAALLLAVLERGDR
ncbi:MAG: hypothetical protein QY326_01630 [Bdellovibrionota bacterium]|nr:MAG: hypothetical protein QY326_01630 [Bdellovibrionota bacterium]